MKKIMFFVLSVVTLIGLTGCFEQNNEFDITFESNGGSIIESITTDGVTIIMPSNPEKDGFLFDGWYYDDETFQEPFTITSLQNIQIKRNMTVYAKWNEVEVSLTTKLMDIFTQGLQSGGIDGQTYEEWLDSIKGPQGEDGREVTFQVEGGYIQWQYVGETTWNNLIAISTLIGPDGADGKEVTFQVDGGYIQWKYVGEDTWTNLLELATILPDDVTVANARTEENGELIITYTDGNETSLGIVVTPYQVIFKNMAGEVIDIHFAKYGESAPAPTIPHEEGYTFIEWDKDFSFIEEHLVVQAVYEKNTYTITFDSNGGNSIEAYTGVEYGASKVLPIPVRDGYTFLGWYYGLGVNEGQFTNKTPVEYDITIFAKWKLN